MKEVLCLIAVRKGGGSFGVRIGVRGSGLLSWRRGVVRRGGSLLAWSEWKERRRKSCRESSSKSGWSAGLRKERCER